MLITFSQLSICSFNTQLFHSTKILLEKNSKMQSIPVMEDQLYRCHTWACKANTEKVGGQPNIWVNELDLSKQQNGTATIIQIS